MGSILMHLYVSEKIKEKYNFSNRFLVGCVLPDLYKRKTNDRDGAHYNEEVIDENGKLHKLPNLKKYCEENKDKKNDEVYIGYFAHLVEDYVWFRYYMDQFALPTDEHNFKDSPVTYAKENHSIVHDNSEFVLEIYRDYSFWDPMLYEKTKINIEEYKQMLKDYLNDSFYSDVIDKEIYIHYPEDTKRENAFITDEVIKRYLITSLELFDREYKKCQESS